MRTPFRYRSTPAYALASLPDLPGSIALAVHVRELLVLLEGVHAPEAVVPVSDELLLLDQAMERLLDQLLALFDVVEDLAPEDEEAAVDQEIRVADVSDLLDGLVLAQ